MDNDNGFQSFLENLTIFHFFLSSRCDAATAKIRHKTSDNDIQMPHNLFKTISYHCQARNTRFYATIYHQPERDKQK